MDNVEKLFEKRSARIMFCVLLVLCCIAVGLKIAFDFLFFRKDK